MIERLFALAKEEENLRCRNGPPPLGRDNSSSSSGAQGARSGALTPADYFSLPLPAGSEPSASFCSQHASQDLLAVPGQVQMSKSDSIATGFSHMDLSSSMSSCSTSMGDGLASAMSGQDWEGDCSLEYEAYFNSFPDLLDAASSNGSLHV